MIQNYKPEDIGKCILLIAFFVLCLFVENAQRICYTNGWLAIHNHTPFISFYTYYSLIFIHFSPPPNFVTYVYGYFFMDWNKKNIYIHKRSLAHHTHIYIWLNASYLYKYIHYISVYYTFIISFVMIILVRDFISFAHLRERKHSIGLQFKIVFCFVFWIHFCWLSLLLLFCVRCYLLLLKSSFIFVAVRLIYWMFCQLSHAYCTPILSKLIT